MSSATNIDQCLASAVVSHTSRAVHQRVEKARFASSTKSCRLVPVLVRVAALLVKCLTAADGRVPAKKLSAPFCLISRATNRLRTSTRSQSPLLMSHHRQESRHARFISYFLQGFEVVRPRHFSMRALATSSLGSGPPVTSSAPSPSQSVTHTLHSSSSPHTSNPHTMASFVAAWIQRSLSSVHCLHFHVALAALLEAPPVISDCGRARLDGLPLTSLYTTSASGLANATLWVKLSSRHFARARSFAIIAVILARHSSVSGCPTNRKPMQPNVAPKSHTIFFVMWIRLPCSSFLVESVLGWVELLAQ